MVSVAHLREGGPRRSGIHTSHAMSTPDRETGVSEHTNEMEDGSASASCYSTVASESAPQTTGGSELVSGTSLRQGLSEAQNDQESGGPTTTEGETWPPTASGESTMSTPFPRRMPSTQARNTPVKVPGQPTTERQGDVQAFQKSIGTPQSSGLPGSHIRFLPSIQKQADENQHKRGICILCACTNAWCVEERIEPSDAVERMRECFEDKLGYLVIQVGTTITSQHLDEVLQELSEIRLPPSYRRVFFYYFGHGTEESVSLADENVERKHIIGRLQSMCPSHSVELFKIFLFDSCRTVSPLTTQPIQVRTGGIAGDLGGGSGQMWQTKQKYPSSTNTLVINATDFNCKAYYIDDKQVHGCGLVTLYFTKLVPKMNASLSEVLTEVRKKVDAYVASHPDNVQRCSGHQVLVYEDRLMGIVNLLAESTGKARVTPKVVTASAQALNANVQWNFSSNVEDHIKVFVVEVTPDGNNGEVDIPAPVRRDPKERFATFSFLKPNTTYRVKVIAEYEDGVQIESENFPFTTSDRSSPQNIKFVRQYPSSQAATVEWSFPGDTSDLSHYLVKAVTDGEQSVEVTVHDTQDKTAILKPLYLSPKYTVTVTAVYRDRIEVTSSAEVFKESSAELFNECDLRAATDMTASVIWLNPLKVEVKWSHQRVENAPLLTGFKVVARADNNGTPLIEKVENPCICQAAMELSHDTTYTFKIVTIYGENTMESKEMEFRTPSENEGKPTIGEIENIQHNSVEITFSDPPFLQKTEYGDWIKLTYYTVTRRPHGQEESNAKSSTFHHNVSSAPSDASPAQPRRMKLAGLIPGKKYKLTVAAHYSNGEAIPTEEEEFTTKPAVLQNVCLWTLIGTFMLTSALLAVTYIPYHVYLQGSGDCQANYILSLDTIQCGYGNSLQYDGAEIKGCPVSGDVMTETLNVWQIRDDELTLHNQTLLPVISKGQTSEHSTFLLLGWEIYTWRDSVIAGFCCIANNNEEEKTASLHMFRNNEDASRFEFGEGVKNAILSEQIHVPPKKTSCFTKWGTNSPFTVVHSSYHYIGVDLPANMNYTANITVTQTYVNTSDYPNSKPKQFRRDNHTCFTYPHTWPHRTEYLYICEAPLISPEHEREPESVSLHVCTCNHPYPWMKPTFTFAAAIGSFGVLYTLSVITCYCLYTNRRKLCAIDCRQYCPCLKKIPRYVRIPDESTGIQNRD